MTQRTRLTMNEKEKIIDYMNTNPKISHSKIASIFSARFKKNVSRRSIADILKNEKNIKETVLKTDRRKMVIKTTQYTQIENKLHDWILFIESKGGCISENIIREKAIEIAKNEDCNIFNASNGWMHRFKKRYNIKEKKICGESQFCNIDDHQVFIEEFKKISADYLPKNIFNCDETSLFYKLVPSKSLVTKARKGIKNYKERLSVLFCCNMDGTEKKKPFVIGKFEKPRCFRGFNLDAFCFYKNNSKAWMSSNLFGSWLQEWDDILHKKGRKILLLMDNFAGHKITFILKNIRIVFLPSNTTSILQPLDAGIIKSFKSRYYRYQMQYIIGNITEDGTIEELYKKFSIKDAIIYLSYAWNDITESCIKNCWRKTKLAEKINLVENANVDEEINLKPLVDALNLQDPVDEEKLLGEDLNCNDILVEELNKEYTNENNTSIEKFQKDIPIEDLESDNEITVKPFINILSNLQEIKNFIYTYEDCEKVTKNVQEIEKYLLSKKKVVQKKITDYLILKK